MVVGIENFPVAGKNINRKEPDLQRWQHCLKVSPDLQPRESRAAQTACGFFNDTLLRFFREYFSALFTGFCRHLVFCIAERANPYFL